MSRINTNVSSLIAQRVLGSQNELLSKSLERLSTGLAINRGADNPGGLIASEALRSEATKLDTAITNAARADQVLNIADGGLSEISSLLTEAQALVTAAGNDSGLSDEEKAANQQQIDSILQTIDRIASTTSFQGVKLLDGGFDFKVSSVSAGVDAFSVNAAKLNFGSTQSVQVVVTQSAQHAGLILSAGGSAIGLSDVAGATLTFELAGAKGSREFSFASGAALSSVAATINTYKSVTGVSATVSANSVLLKSTELGSDQFVSFKITEGAASLEGGGVYGFDSGDEDAVGSQLSTYDSATSGVRDDGQDVAATINGLKARGQGGKVSINSELLDISVTLGTSGAQTLGALDALTIKGGGAKFSIGPSNDLNNSVTLGLQNIASRNLGSADIGYLDDLGSGKSLNLIDGDLETAQKAVDAAISHVATLRGRIGAFQKNVIGSTISSLSVALENTSAAESAIRDTDFAKETASLTRSQILVNAATSALGIANSNPQNVLRLL